MQLFLYINSFAPETVKAVHQSCLSCHIECTVSLRVPLCLVLSSALLNSSRHQAELNVHTYHSAQHVVFTTVAHVCTLLCARSHSAGFLFAVYSYPSLMTSVVDFSFLTEHLANCRFYLLKRIAFSFWRSVIASEGRMDPGSSYYLGS